jgi:hypothetical protein
MPTTNPVSPNNATAANASNQLLSFWEIAKPQYSNIVFYDHRYILPMNVFKSLGLMREIAGESAFHFEAGWIHPNFHVSNSTSGTIITVTVAVADVQDGTVYPRVTDTVVFKDGNAGVITGKTGTSITITTLDSGQSLSVTAGDAIWITGNSQAEASSAPDSRVTGRSKYEFPLQIIRETVDMTGSALTSALWYEKDQFGNMRDTYNSGYLDAEFRFLEQLGNTAIFGPVNNNTTAITPTNMYSMDYVTSTSGKTLPYVAGNYGINEFKENIRYARKKASGSKFLVMAAPELSLSMTTGLSDVFTQNPNLFGTVGKSEFSSTFTAGYENDAKEKQVDINFKKINYDGIDFHIVNVQQWGIEVGGGANGFKQTGYGFFIPLTKAQDAAGTLMDRFMMTYKKKDRWNRAMQVWETGAQAQVPTNDVDELKVNYLGHWGTEFFGAEHFQRVKPA